MRKTIIMQFQSSFATLDEAYGDVSAGLYSSSSETVWGDKRIAKDAQKKKEEEIARQKFMKKRTEEERKAKEEERKAKEEYERRLAEYRELHGDYWGHPEVPNCLIPLEIRDVPAKDTVNRYTLMLQDGGEYDAWMTLVGTNREPWTNEEYYDMFCERHDDKYYYVGRK